MVCVSLFSVQCEKQKESIPILNAAFPLTAPGSARLFGPETLSDSVVAGLIQQYCSTN